MSPTAYPTSLDSQTAGTSTDPLSSPDHAAQHDVLNGSVTAVETKLGTGASVPTTAGHVLTVTGAGATGYAAPDVTQAELDAHAAAADPHTGYRLESATIGTADLTDAGVSLAKMANIATDRLIGRDTAATGVPEALTVGGGVEFSGAGGVQRSALTGDVTAAAGSNATTLAAGSASNLNSGTLPAGRMPAHTGDVTSSVGAVALTIANDAVTYAKMQNVSATDKLLGRATAGAGDVEEIALTGAGRALIDDANATAQLVTLGAYPLPWGRSTSFPGSPVTGQRHTRSDRGIDYEWDGTRWLSVQLYFLPIPFATGTDAYAVTTTGERVGAPWMGVYSIWLVDFQLSFYINGGTALGASHKWVSVLFGTGNTLATINIDSGASNAQRSLTTAVGAVEGTTVLNYYVTHTKTGTPGNISSVPGFTYRLIG